ncbi:MAG: cobalt transporter CbiM [Kiritimatiellae bacterium]|nr:cobalt transporter CbiM [Kiritimatiellia bacterium]
MHISDGILSPEILAGGAILAVGGVALGLRKMDCEEVPKVAVLSAALFVASLIHIPLGPSSVHIVLCGLAGLVLGWMVFPALLVALSLQAVLPPPIQAGGITTLGINTFNMAMPAVICFYLFRYGLRRTNKPGMVFAIGFAAGALSDLFTIAMLAISLFTTGKGFLAVATTISIAHIPVLILDGVITGSILVFLRRVRPEILELHHT